MFNERQRSWLFKKLDMRRVKTRQGMSYLEAWDIIAQLNRMFGFEGWDKHVLDLTMLYDDFVTWTDSKGVEKKGWDVAYRATVRLAVRSDFVYKVSEDAATGQAQHQPSRGDAHDLAVKSAVSDALKRCAKDLGDQFGLGLYNDGTGDSFIRESLAYPKAGETELPPPDPEISDKVAGVRQGLLTETPQ